MSQRVTRAPLGDRLLRAGLAAVAAEAGDRRTEAALRARPSAAGAVLAVGKAAWSMVLGATRAIGERPCLVVVRDPPPVPWPPGFDLVVAGHPYPDERSVAAAGKALALAAAAEGELLVLLSGGASALLGAPIEGVSLQELAWLTRALLSGGAPIEALNQVRRRLGRALGGRLGAACRASVRALVLSDVASCDPRVIGSGPFSVPPADDPERAAAAAAAIGAERSLVDRIRLAPAPSRTAPLDLEILAGPRTLRATAAAALAGEGLRVEVDEGLADGPVEALAGRLVAAARRLAPGTAYLVVGEPTVRVHGSRPGGRAQHAALLCARDLADAPDRACLALASDGSDGPTDAAGAIVDGGTAARLRERGLDIDLVVAELDAHRALEAVGALVRTGPTGTNLTDLYVVARA